MEQWLIGIATGVISGLLVSYLFYRLAGRDLQHEARELKRVSGVLLRALRDDRAEIEWDEHGAPQRLHYKIDLEPAEIKLTGGIVNMTVRDKDGNIKETR